MVHISRVELTNFKSFGGTTEVPLLPGFTIITGPNGSGKSNIIDAMLFALGLSTSKGMRADRLPDLINHTYASRKRFPLEAAVKVTFDVSDRVDPESNGQAPKEWQVTRKLRVTKGGSYSSAYAMNGVACDRAELHEYLNQLCIYPEGYNIVLQGDVTGIITMNGKERRQIVDELAGVGAFDRKIATAREKLDEVKERLERSRILEEELTRERNAREKECAKARRYKTLKEELEVVTEREALLRWRYTQQQEGKVREQIAEGESDLERLGKQQEDLQATVGEAIARLEQLNRQIKAMGEEELLQLQAELARKEAEAQQLARQIQEWRDALADMQKQQQSLRQQNAENQGAIAQIATERETLQSGELAALERQRSQQELDLQRCREEEGKLGEAAEAWMRAQGEVRRKMEAVRSQLEPLRSEAATLQERSDRLQQQQVVDGEKLAQLDAEIAEKAGERDRLQAEEQGQIEAVRRAAADLAAAEAEAQTQQETQERLQREQRENLRVLDKLEAQTQVLRESRGTHALQVLLDSGLEGICGTVAQLGRVEEQYRYALEIAAGGRLGQIVVENARVASAGIQLLKENKAGRATFLPLDELRSHARLAPIFDAGFIDYAFRLVDYDPRYEKVFGYVFGSTAVFDGLANARRCLGRYRIVTLEGELLETTGAMTGGSRSDRRGGWSFSQAPISTDGEIARLRSRSQDLEKLLARSRQTLQAAAAESKTRSQALMEAKSTVKELQLKAEQSDRQVAYLSEQSDRLRQQQEINLQESAAAAERLQQIRTEIPQLEAQLEVCRQEAAALEASAERDRWQELQQHRETLERSQRQTEDEIRQGRERLNALDNQTARLEEAIRQNQQRVAEFDRRNAETEVLHQEGAARLAAVSQTVTELQDRLRAIVAHLGEVKTERDAAEQSLEDLRQQQRDLQWEREKLEAAQQERRDRLERLRVEIAERRKELPETLPPVPEKVTQKELTDLERKGRSLQQSLRALEPVNMLALEEYEALQKRLQELSEKLDTLESERTDILLRIENFTTMRQQAFTTAFDAINQNFQAAFAQLSDGDGYLELDDPQNIFQSGLNLVAHPKGKPVRRLASMSGGEKSLTALSFIFALQRYRPSPFYAFDEVDMFLDGSNAERLAKMIVQQRSQAQFIVVSHKLPTIKAADRTIGVTQARGAHTQVVGLDLSAARAPK